MGAKLDDWLAANQMLTLNDGSPTRYKGNSKTARRDDPAQQSDPPRYQEDLRLVGIRSSSSKDAPGESTDDGEDEEPQLQSEEGGLDSLPM